MAQDSGLTAEEQRSSDRYSMKTDTPRAEAEYYTVESAANYGMGDEYADHVVPVEFARQLERELNAANARIAKLEQRQEKENSVKSDKDSEVSF